MWYKNKALPFILGVVCMIVVYISYNSSFISRQRNDAPEYMAGQTSRDEGMNGGFTTTSVYEFEGNGETIREELQETLSTVKSRIEDVGKLLETRKTELGIDDEMMKLALKHTTSVERLVQKFKEVLLTRRTFSISVVGGSISVGAGVGGTPGIYATTMGKYLQKMLGSDVTVENGAIGATNSYYYAYCFQTHCDVHGKDLLLWEFAHNDFGYEDGYLGQERLTRMILADLPNKPQLIYTNFLHGRQIHRYSCANSEKYGSTPLSEYYDVPSISMPDAVCKLVKEYKADDLLGENDGNHPGPKAHDMVAVYLTEFVKRVLEKTVEGLQKRLDKSEPIIEYIEKGKPDVKSWDDDYLHQDALPTVLFNTTAISHPQCWSQMKSEYRPSSGLLVPADKYGWKKYTLKNREDRTDEKMVWRTLQADAFIKFNLDIKPYRDYNATIAITTITCERNKCGFAKIFLDNKYLTEIDCINRYLVTVVHEVAFDVPPGKHVIKVVSQDGEGFNIASVSYAMQIPTEENLN